jgi:hypothetical protein
MNSGWVLCDGAFAGLDKTRSRMRNYRDPTTGWSSHMQVDLADDLGRTMEIEGFAVSRMSELGYGTNQLMRWEFDGKIGWGEDQDVWDGVHFVRMMARSGQARAPRRAWSRKGSGTVLPSEMLKPSESRS